MDTKKKAVGIQLMGRDADGELLAILQVRAKWNAEKNAPESWPGACQVTAHGKLEKGENFIQGLLREVEEELGGEAASALHAQIENLKELRNVDTPEKHIITYGLVLEEGVLRNMLARAKSSTFGGFQIIRESDIDKIIDIQKIDKEKGVTEKNVIAMFPDEKEAVKIAFEKLKP